MIRTCSFDMEYFMPDTRHFETLRIYCCVGYTGTTVIPVVLSEIIYRRNGGKNA